MLRQLYSELPEAVTIRYSGVTGYGEKINSNSSKCWFEWNWNNCSLYSCKKFMPNVTSIVDIGGQDMKYIKMKMVQ